MRDRGHEVHWVALNIPKYVIPNITIHNSVRLYGRSLIGRYLLTPHIFFLFKKKIKQISPDIVHAINVEWAGWFSVLSGFKKVVVTTQGGDVMIRQNMNNHFIKRWLRSYTLQNAAVVTYGNDTMLDYIKLWGSPKRVFKYFAGVNFELTHFKTSSHELREELGVGYRRVVFSPRMFETNSNIDILIQTIPLVKKRFPDVIYIFATHYEISNHSLRMKELIKKLDVEGSCLFVGEILPSEMARYYALSDVVISILSSDGMPATLLETMAMKKTLVLSKIPSYLGLINDNYALMAKLRDKQSTANAIIKGLTQDEETTQMKETAYHWVKQNADLINLNDKIEKLYFEIVQ
jgi:glycosyltransferase involved in cell wall biosynthesis